MVVEEEAAAGTDNTGRPATGHQAAAAKSEGLEECHHGLCRTTVRQSEECHHGSGHVRLRDGTETCNFRGNFATFFLSFLFMDFSFFSRFSVYISEEITPNVEKIARFQGREKSAESCRVSGCHGRMGLHLDVSVGAIRTTMR